MVQEDQAFSVEISFDGEGEFQQIEIQMQSIPAEGIPCRNPVGNR